jgi:hypothetical protein
MKMIKLSILMVRRSDFTYDKFIKYWREVHAPLFAAQSESQTSPGRDIQARQPIFAPAPDQRRQR